MNGVYRHAVFNISVYRHLSAALAHVSSVVIKRILRTTQFAIRAFNAGI